MQATPAILFTDLDGTLLDHHDYGFDAAAEALRRVRADQIPLVLTTSKTLAEVAPLNRTLDNPQAAIVENGGAIAIPGEHVLAAHASAAEAVLGHRLLRFSPDYTTIRRFFTGQREQHGLTMRGFGDMDLAEITALTGLAERDAARAAQRLCSEPFVWQGSAQELSALRDAARLQGMTITRGGRFHHLMGQTSKAAAMQTLFRLFRDLQPARPICVALGDSDNDTEMLSQADIAVVVRRHDGSHLGVEGRHRTIRTEHAGPAGWNAAVLQILTELGARHPAA